VLQEDSSENDEVLKSIYFSMWKNFRTAPNVHSISYNNYLVCYCRESLPSSEAHKQFGAEPTQYRLEINFNSKPKPLVHTAGSICTFSVALAANGEQESSKCIPPVIPCKVVKDTCTHMACSVAVNQF